MVGEIKEETQSADGSNSKRLSRKGLTMKSSRSLTKSKKSLKSNKSLRGKSNKSLLSKASLKSSKKRSGSQMSAPVKMVDEGCDALSSELGTPRKVSEVIRHRL